MLAAAPDRRYALQHVSTNFFKLIETGSRKPSVNQFPRMADSPPQPRLIIRLLGDLGLTLDGMAPTGKLYGKALALLAYLAVESSGQPHTREQLATLLWPALPMETARVNLRQAAYHLRQALRDQAHLLAAGRDTLRFAATPDDCLVDAGFLTSPLPPCGACAADGAGLLCAGCLASLKARLDAYAGDFLPGLALADAPDFDNWRNSQREALRCHALTLAERLRDHHDRAGQHEQALLYSRRCVQLDPWNDASHRQHMRLLAAGGRQGAAQSHYDAYRADLERDVNAEPESRTHELFEHIHRHGRAPVSDSRAIAAPAIERRQGTVLCCHISGPPTLDPEALAGPRGLCAAVLRRHGGHVTPGHDGYLFAYMGYPIASEDAVQRAASGALALAAQIDPSLRLRVGLHIGAMMAVSDPALPDAAGVVSGTAWRLCKRAGKHGIVVSEAAAALLRQRFRLEPLPASASAGKQDIGGAFRLSAAWADRRCRARPGAAALLGRRAEMLRLMASWRRAERGTAQVVLLRGEAGIGKTRLARALRDKARERGAAIGELHCFPEHRHTPLHPVIALLHSLLGIADDDAPGQRCAKLKAYLDKRHPALAGEALHPLAALLSAQPADAPARTPRQHRRRTLDALTQLLDGQAARRPLLLVVEDLHWADWSTMDFLAQLARREPQGRVLILLTARSDFQCPWMQDDRLMELAPLKDSDIVRLTRAINPRLAGPQAQRLARRADGIALYAEELALMSLQDARDAGPIPPTLHYLLLARLDALPQARRLIQLAATIGRNFDRALLARVADLNPQAMDAALDPLREARIVAAMPEAGDGAFQFRHALIQEAAYDSQSRADRREGHRRIAEALKEHFPSRATRQPGQAARHYTEAGLAAQAVPWWLRAGRQALRVSANTEACEHLRAGLRLVAGLPPGGARDAQELSLLLPLGQALLMRCGYGSDEARQVYDRAFALDGGQASPRQRFEILWGQWMVSSSRPGSDFIRSRELAQDLLRLAQASGDAELLVQAYSAHTNIALWRNEIDAACDYADMAMTLAHGDAFATTLEGPDPRVTSLAHLSWARSRQGRPNEARQAGRRAIELAQRLDNPDTMCFALGFAAMQERFLGKTDEALAYAHKVRSIADAYQLVLWQDISEMILAWGQACHGDPAGISRLRACTQRIKRIMPGVSVMFWHALAEAYGFLGRRKEQLWAIGQGSQAARAVDERFFGSDLQRLREKVCPPAA